jgi:hypothetical protein
MDERIPHISPEADGIKVEAKNALPNAANEGISPPEADGIKAEAVKNPTRTKGPSRSINSR